MICCELQNEDYLGVEGAGREGCKEVEGSEAGGGGE